MYYRILIVDDSSTTRAMISRILNLSKLPIGQLYEAGNGQEALESLAQNWIDLVITDINMPQMNGLELVRRMAADHQLSTTPVIVISTEGSEERINELKALGIAGFLRKPFTPEAVRDLVVEILKDVKSDV